MNEKDEVEEQYSLVNKDLNEEKNINTSNKGKNIENDLAKKVKTNSSKEDNYDDQDYQFDDYKEEDSFDKKIPDRFPGTGFGFNKN